MSDRATKLNIVKERLLLKKKLVENQIENMEWHGVAGPTLMIEVEKLELINELLNLCI